MSIYQYVDPTADQAEELFWSLVSVVAEQAGVTDADAFHHTRRVWVDRLKALKPHHAIDHPGDGRSAIWRVRLTVWGGPDKDTQMGDSDSGRPFEQDGATLLSGLGAVAAWVRELVPQLHPGYTLDGLEEAVLANKLKSLRVALSNASGSAIWRLRYIASPPAAPLEHTPGSLRGIAAHRGGPQAFLAHVRITREESPRHTRT